MKGRVDDIVSAAFADDGRFPNSTLPVVIYRQALEEDDAGVDAFERLFKGNGWPPQWRSGVFDYHHFHSTSHECLGIASGEARLMLGGPEGQEFDVGAGDMIVIPAGVAHRRLTASADFLVVGAYPPGAEWDLLRGGPEDRPGADRNISAVPMPETDPVSGTDTPLLELWRGD